MDRKIIVTEDNSKTLLIPSMNETYHSTHGALNEALHVFVASGLTYFDQKAIKVFEMGFGTGLNALVSLDYAMEHNKEITYTSIEKYPLEQEIITAMDYPQQMETPHLLQTFATLHDCPWEFEQVINSSFTLKKLKGDIQEAELPHTSFDIIFYDAFGPRVQPLLWSTKVLKKMFDILKTGGILVTYCAQGQFKRNLKTAGFQVENLPGPPGKREMTRAIKPQESL